MKKTTKKAGGGRGGRPRFTVAGRVQLESLKTVPNDLNLTAFAFNSAGEFIGSIPVSDDGQFSLPVPLSEPEDVEVFVAPEIDPKEVRQAASYSRRYSAQEWTGRQRDFTLQPNIYVLTDSWRHWWPLRICISGHVRKLIETELGNRKCPVPFAKVEVFDVDRESCWWPYIVNLRPLLPERSVFDASEVLRQRVEIPGSVRERVRLARPVEIENPQESRSAASSAPTTGLEEVGFNPQPEPPADFAAFSSEIQAPRGGQRVGEVAALSDSEARSFDNLSLTSAQAPWVIFPGCFYSKAKVCQDYTDCNGYFRCCFRWWPFHFRRGRLRFDLRPDIVIRVTQVINGVEKVIYIDPYTSTRWNVTSAHIDLCLDDEEVVCGPGCGPDIGLTDSQATVYQIGADPVWRINKANSRYTAFGESNGAYGKTLYVRGDFSANLKLGDDSAPAAKRYYKLSYAKAAGGGGVPPDAAFTAIQTPLSAYRANINPPGQFLTYLLGPQPAGPLEGLYEVQDTNHWWIIPGIGFTSPGGKVLGYWPTTAFESDEDVYWLRMEVFNSNGTKLNTVEFPNHEGNGSGVPVVPTVTNDHLDLKVHLDNKVMSFNLTTPASNACGVVPWSQKDQLINGLVVHASQENGRVHRWLLRYNKGVNPTEIQLGSATYPSGTSPVNQAVDGSPMLSGLTTTCAFGLHLYARAHVRVNYGWHNYGRKSYAIAIEKCP